MKTLLTLTLLMLVCFLKLNSATVVAVPLILRDGCCPRIGKVKIPNQMVKHVAMTPSFCKPQAIIVTTVADKKFCLDVEDKHAKKQLEKFQKKIKA